MGLNVRQRKAIKANDSQILCLAAPGSGKTRVLTERIYDLITNKKVNPKDIVAISFTNLAADTMKRRLGNICEGAFIGTIHSYANLVCLQNGVETIYDVVDHNFDKILEKALKIPRKKYPKVKHLLVDECQDLDPLQTKFLIKMPAENTFYVGDENQEIYGFRGSSLAFLKEMYEDESVAKYYLTQNYRNCPNIIKFAEDFLQTTTKLSPSTEPVKTEDGTLIDDCTIEEALDELERIGNYGSWFVLTRTNRELGYIQEFLKEKKIPNVTFKKGDLDLDTITELMQSNRVKCLTIHSAKGLEAKNVIVTGARIYNAEERRIAYVAATRAENSLYWCPTFSKRKLKNKPKITRSTRAGNTFAKSSMGIIEF